MDDLGRRALAAYFRSASREHLVVDQPINDPALVTHAGKTYVVIFNVRGPLAVYRVRNDGLLKRLKRWPTAVAER
jgi:hypothetical protein